MAGTNKVFKENDILFRSGDPADAMYIVRKGSLKVYLQKGGEEVALAVLKDGAIVGEMAFFDDKPRSASVKASAPTECTVITRGDFEKLLKQIPPWFVAMMKSLSGRLRQTNDRLQALESGSKQGGPAPAAGGIRPNQDYPFQGVLRCLNLVMLAFARDGIKDNPKELMLDLEIPRRLWGDFFGEGERTQFDGILGATVKAGFITLKGSPKPTTIVFVNRGGLAHFMQFFGEVAKKLSPSKPFLSKGAVTLFDALVEAEASSGYPSVNVSVGEVATKAAAKGHPHAQSWATACGELGVLPDIKVTGSGNGATVKITVKDHKLFAQYLKYMQLFFDDGLA